MNKYTLRQTPLSAVIGSVLASGSAQAAIITVNTNQDAPVGTVTTHCTLRDAVHAANTGAPAGGCEAGSSNHDEIVFGALQSSTITLSEGEMMVTGPLTINGAVAGDTTRVLIDADKASRVFRAVAGVPGQFEFVLREMRLRNGSIADGSGGAISALGANLALDEVSVKYSAAVPAAAGRVGVGTGMAAGAPAAGAAATTGASAEVDCAIAVAGASLRREASVTLRAKSREAP